MNKKDLQNPIREFRSKDGNSPITEANLTKVQLDKREDYLKQLKKNKKELVKRYGKDAESVMYGRATNLAKKAVSEMDKQKLKELVKTSLMKEADIETMADRIGGEEILSQASIMLDDLEQKLKTHDWFYMMSDDNRAYTNGSAQQSEIRKIIKNLESLGYNQDAKDLYNKYAPYTPGSSDLRMKEAKDEVEENKVYGPGELDFSSFITPEQKIVAKAFMVDPTRTKFDYKNNTVIFPDPLRIELAKGGETMLGSVKMGNRLGFVKGYFDEDGNEIEGAYIKMPSKYPMGEGKKTDMDKDGDIDSKDYLLKRDAAIQKAKGEMKEDIDLGHEDNEPHMIKGELYQIGKYAMKLYATLEELEETGQEIDFPAWWQSKITTAKNMMSGARHYLDFELKEPYIDAAVDALTGEAPHMGEPEPPMMEAEIGKDEILAGKIMKALKDMANKDASDQNNLKQARTALNKGNMDAAEKIAKPYLSEKIAKQLKEYTYDDFSGSKLIANTPIPTDINIFKKFFPTGVASMGTAKASLQASDNTGIKDRMGRYAPMFAHVQYHEFEDQTGEKYRAHQTQYYNSNFDKQDPNFNPSVTDLTLFKLASPDGLSKDTNIGSILVKTDAYIKDLAKLNISKKAM